MSSTLSGEQLEALADTQSWIYPSELALAIEIASILLGTIATIVICLRLWVRTSWSLSADVRGMDDYMAALGFLPFIPSCVFAVMAARSGLGHRDNDASSFQQLRAAKYMIYWEIHYLFASTMTKCSIGFFLMRMTPQRKWKIAFGTNMALMGIVALGSLAFVLNNCKPFPATWNQKLGECAPSSGGLTIVSYVLSGFQMITDWFYSITPGFIVVRLNMPIRRRIYAISILGLGAFASVATVLRLPWYKYYDHEKFPADFMYNIGWVVFWSIVECSLGIIAGSLPPLGKLFLLVPARVGPTKNIGFVQEMADASNTELKILQKCRRSHNYALPGLSGCGNWDHMDEETSSQKAILQHQIGERV